MKPTFQEIIDLKMCTLIIFDQGKYNLQIDF